MEHRLHYRTLLVERRTLLFGVRDLHLQRRVLGDLADGWSLLLRELLQCGLDNLVCWCNAGEKILLLHVSGFEIV